MCISTIAQWFHQLLSTSKCQQLHLWHGKFKVAYILGQQFLNLGALWHLWALQIHHTAPRSEWRLLASHFWVQEGCSKAFEKDLANLLQFWVCERSLTHTQCEAGSLWVPGECLMMHSLGQETFLGNSEPLICSLRHLGRGSRRCFHFIRDSKRNFSVVQWHKLSLHITTPISQGSVN